MARARLLKPGFFLNEELCGLPMAARLLFEGLWCLADREGRLEDRPKRIDASVFPYDDVDINALLDSLAGAGFIERYEAEGKRYIQITNFLKHQKPHPNEPASNIPPPPSAINDNNFGQCNESLQPMVQVASANSKSESGRSRSLKQKPIPKSEAEAEAEAGLQPLAEVASASSSSSSLLAQMVNSYENEIGLLTPAVAAELDDWVDALPEANGSLLVDYAFGQAAAQNKRSWSYVRAVLRRLEDSGWAIPDARESSISAGAMLSDQYRRRYEMGKAKAKEAAS